MALVALSCLHCLCHKRARTRNFNNLGPRVDQSGPGGVGPVHSEGLGGVTLSQDTTGARVSLRQISQHQNENDYRN